MVPVLFYRGHTGGNTRVDGLFNSHGKSVVGAEVNSEWAASEAARCSCPYQHLALGTVTFEPAPLDLSWIVNARSSWNCLRLRVLYLGKGHQGSFCCLSLLHSLQLASVLQTNGPQSWSVRGKELDHDLPTKACGMTEPSAPF